MSFIFASSHLPETRAQRPDELEDEDDDVQPMLHSGGVRAFSHLPAKRVAADPAGQFSQRGAQALSHQFQRTETEDADTPPEVGISAAKASGVFDAVRQQFNRDDSPHFMDEDGNLRPRDEARQQDSPALRDLHSPQFGAGAPPRPAWSAGHAADSSRSPLTSSSASDDTRPWYMPPITPADLDSQHHDDDAAAGSHPSPKDRPEVQDLVYRTPGASTPKPGLQDLVYRFNGNPEEASDHRRDYIQNTAAPADGRGHLAQQTKTYGAAPDSRGNGSSHGYADNAGSGKQSDATTPGTYKPYRSIYQDVMDGHKKSEAEVEPTVEMLEQKEKALEAEANGARLAQHQQLEALKNLRELRMFMEGTDAAQDLGKKGMPKKFRKPFDRFNDRLGLSPEQIIAKIDADIQQRQNELLKYYEEVEKANMSLHQAKMETEAAKKKELEKKQNEEQQRKELEEKQKAEQLRKELEEKQKAEQLRRELEEKQKQSLQSPSVFA